MVSNSRAPASEPRPRQRADDAEPIPRQAKNASRVSRGKAAASRTTSVRNISDLKQCLCDNEETRGVVNEDVDRDGQYR